MFSPYTIQRQRFQKIALIILFFLLSVALIITWNTPATGYEASIYRSTPLILWVSVIASVIVGVALVVVAIAKNKLDGNPFWKIGFLLVFLSYTVCLGLFIIRGYYMWCMTGDPASHIGWIKETLNAGHAPTSVIYPITHIYLSEIVFLTGLDLVFLHKIVPLIFGLLCVLFMYVFARALFSRHDGVLLAGLISCCMAFDWYLNLTPNALANLFLPFALLLVVRSLQQRKWPWTLALSAVILLYPVFHPVPAIFLGTVFLTLWIPPLLPRITMVIRERKIGNFDFSRRDLRLVLPLVLLVIWFIFWISSFSAWGWTIQSMYQTIVSEGSPSKLMDLTDQISYAQGYGYSVIEQVIRRLWCPLILSILSVISLPMLWRDFTHRHQEKCLFSFYGPLGMLALIIPGLYLFNLAFGPLRLVIYVSMLGTLFAAYLFACLLTGERRNHGLYRPNLRTVFVILVILAIFTGGMLNLYPSPYNLTQNYQTTRSEVTGMVFIYQHRDIDVPLTGINIAPGRFANAFLTPEERGVQHLPLYLEDQIAPYHFGYDNFTTISYAYDEETDLAIKQQDKVVYIDYFPDMAQYRFSTQDFERLKNDPGVDSLYTNGEFELHKVKVIN
ncbi:glycosyltransferase family 39 protein [Methanoculleus sp.]|uniref:glycosyltransferase family 39 protein n=1 Tax=Methanoculleus sp. TaxID=90427 RepID=UPI0026126C55|nr:glycosyltransferase family 39 protein [Methanoculleus sp.]MDI6867847.1 glycosyltransferase family 39 protein [Methanoculleus sp.]